MFRACFNFQHKCSLSCTYCYIPFGPGAVDAHLVLEIIDRLADLGVDVITFGGGDPFQYREITDFLRETKRHNMFAQVDTNSLGHYRDIIKDVFPLIDLISFPLDGPVAAIHDFMRSAPGNFKRVMSGYDQAHKLGMNIKINTLISSINIRSIGHISRLVLDLSPRIWSIYQYWPLQAQHNFPDIHSVGDELFNSCTASLRNISDEIVVEVSTPESRAGHYFFVSHNGTVYTHGNLDKYIELGSVFDHDILARWREYAPDSVRSNAWHRYA